MADQCHPVINSTFHVLIPAASQLLAALKADRVPAPNGLHEEAAGQVLGIASNSAMHDNNSRPP